MSRKYQKKFLPKNSCQRIRFGLNQQRKRRRNDFAVDIGDLIGKIEMENRDFILLVYIYLEEMIYSPKKNIEAFIEAKNQEI